jgi:hypothetical protein
MPHQYVCVNEIPYHPLRLQNVLTIICVASKQAKSIKLYRNNLYIFNFKSRLNNKSA